MKIKLWGVRGSVPTPLDGTDIENKLRMALALAKPGDVSSEESINTFIDTLPFSIKSTYGGNTTCIQLLTSDNEQIIFDCGTGIRKLGLELLKGEFSRGNGVANILMTHTHWDHIQGIPFFGPFYFAGNRFLFYSPIHDLKKRLEYQHYETHFPISLDFMPAMKEFFEITADEEFFINDTSLFAKKMPHPGSSYGYRVVDGDSIFVYTSDCEFNIDSIDEIDTYEDLFINADVAVFDTQYTFEESINKLEWGHSSAAIAIDIAERFNVKRLILFHHDPGYDDEKLEIVLSTAKTYLKMKARKSNIELDIAYEGMEIEI